MQRSLEKFSKTPFDLLIIGGGINGASLAHLAALHGLKTGLVEKNDFASGTSSKSSKLIHGGLRYLENFQFKLVREALRERAFHLEKASHLVQPLAFTIPVYRGDQRPLWVMALGGKIYDLLAGDRKIGRSGKLSRSGVLKREPAVNPDGLKGGVLYYDAQMDDARLCLEHILSADSRGAVVANYAAVTGFIKENDRAVGLRIRDCLKPCSEDIEVRAKHIFCTAGPWTDDVLRLDDPAGTPQVRTTKGVHIVTAKSLSREALLIPSREDSRVFFVLPWKGGTMIGTTDTDFHGSPDEVEPSPEDVEYLIRQTRRIFPAAGLSERDFEIRFAGLRPLIYSGGKASMVPREHAIFRTRSGIYGLVGGKFTTYRVIAKDCLSRIHSVERDIETLYGTWEKEGSEGQNLPGELPPDTQKKLKATYGSRSLNIAAMAQENPALKEKIHPALPYIKAQIAYAMSEEMAVTYDDVLGRRLSAGYSARDMAVAGEAFERAWRSLL